MTTDDFADATWFKSSRSDENVAECVEVAVLPGRVGVRDSKAHGHGPVLTFPPAQWRAFVTAVLTDKLTPR
ncbi:DUF397 domain-containing protein [Pseudonocardia acaciae]|uniref:DUF397 domain-containing protein n=1 Tax=Pseudonocardia acaciae TaxID=551276 RepID=UPI000490C340|nr:DUF397 domain-containing protein [Pseudonocardia acaciae]